jgi:hypothetical protein
MCGELKMTIENNIVSVELTIKSLRDSAYKNTAYAAAELIDNSIQAEAKLVELVCVEETTFINGRQGKSISEIAVIDNGHGMSEDLLARSLRFGDGTHLDQKNQKGMGKFGMGLPSASISQARRVEVWSWQNGIESALYTYIDVDEMEKGLLSVVPKPVKKLIPDIYIKNSSATACQSGTLVRWTNLDRVFWKTPKAIFENSEALIGRMYRYFIYEGRVKIRFCAVDGTSKSVIYDNFAKPVDPLYLMTGTATPEPYDEVAAFTPYPSPENYSSIHRIEFRGAEHEVKIKFSVASKETRARGGLRNMGSTPLGRHCKKNQGVSVLRAGRELDLFDVWSDAVDIRHRWWGAEIDFPPALDDLFGVTNDKQDARVLRSVAMRYDFESINNIATHYEDLLAEDDNRAEIVRLVWIIRQQIKYMHSLIVSQLKKTEAKEKRYEGSGMVAVQQATQATEKRIEDGNDGASDRDAEINTEEYNKAELQQELINDGAEETEASEITNYFFDIKSKYVIDQANLDGLAMFSVRKAGGKMLVTLNMRHPLYNRLIGILDRHDDTDRGSETDADRLEKANIALKVLICAWARMEDEASTKYKETCEEVRFTWSRVAHGFLEVGGDDNE